MYAHIPPRNEGLTTLWQVGSGFCKQVFSFHRCMQSLQAGYDLRQFFGGMSFFHDSRALLASLGVAGAQKFPNNFLDDTGSDPGMHVARLSGEVHCISVRIWDALLWFSIMRRPRR